MNARKVMLCMFLSLAVLSLLDSGALQAEEKSIVGKTKYVLGVGVHSGQGGLARTLPANFSPLSGSLLLGAQGASWHLESRFSHASAEASERDSSLTGMEAESFSLTSLDVLFAHRETLGHDVSTLFGAVGGVKVASGKIETTAGRGGLMLGGEYLLATRLGLGVEGTLNYVFGETHPYPGQVDPLHVVYIDATLTLRWYL